MSVAKLRPADPLLTTKEAAEYLGFSPKTLEDMRFDGRGPSYAKLGGFVRYRVSDLDGWIKASIVKPKVTR